MRYLLMIYTDETVEANMSPEEQGAYMAAYNAFTKATRDRNAFQAGEALQSTATATTVPATTVVSSKLLSKMAAAEHVVYAETLTGFKWIARAIAEHPQSRFVFGYEQALGYLIGDTLTRDKDGITAALVMAEIAALAKLHGVTVEDRLEDIRRRYGRHRLAERSLRLEPDEMRAFMNHLRAEPPEW